MARDKTGIPLPRRLQAGPALYGRYSWLVSDGIGEKLEKECLGR